jgi:hypothetical protein
VRTLTDSFDEFSSLIDENGEKEEEEENRAGVEYELWIGNWIGR